ncbi:hypothetical protein ABC345_20750 [Shouchella sp. 1P09AA]|uniref:hypothetical protein n=1 Tax=unclassified Shouchella TaxID=2893065 RepID=UPI0039A1AD76
MESRFFQGLAIIALILFFISLYTQVVVLLITAVILMIVPVGRHFIARLRNGEIMKALLILFVIGFVTYVVFEVFNF